MSVISSLGSFSIEGAPSQVKRDLGKGEKAARDFEAQLIGTVLQSLEKSLAALPGQNQIAAEDDYNDLATEALSSALAARGGFGLARLIASHLADTKLAPSRLPQAAAPLQRDSLKFP